MLGISVYFITPGASLSQHLWGHPVLLAEGLLHAELTATLLGGELILPGLGAAPLARPISGHPDALKHGTVHLKTRK